MSDETALLPCPMCGAAWPSVQVRWIGFTHTHNGAFSAGYRGECCDCGLTTRAFDGEAEAIVAWNTRATLGGGECEWELEHSGTLYDKWRCSECKFLFVEPRCDQGYMDLVPNYCPNCGKAVKR